MMFRKIFSGYTSRIIILNVIIFLVALLVGFFIGQDKIIGLLALKPSSILQGKSLWTLITSMFMHGGFPHLIFNMISLAFVGTFIERIIGKRRFILFYLLSGIIAGILFVLLAGFFGSSYLGGRLFGNPDVFGVGASGAIFGLVGLIAILTPKNKVYLIAGPLIAIILEAILGNFLSQNIMSVISVLSTIYIFVSIFAMFSFNPKTRRFALPLEMPFWLLPIIAIVPLVVIGLFVELPIANSAHFGGLLVGLLYGLYLKIKYPKKTAIISRYFSK